MCLIITRPGYMSLSVFACSVCAYIMRSVQAVICSFSRRIARVVAWFATEPHPHQERFQEFQRKFLILFSITRRECGSFFCFFLQRERMDYAINPSYRSPFFTKNCQSYRLVCHRTASTPRIVSIISAEISHNFLHNSPRVCYFLITIFSA